MLCGDTAKAEDMNCKSETRKERRNSPSARQCHVPYQHSVKGDHFRVRVDCSAALSYTPDLVPSDFRPFGLMKDVLHKKHFADDGDIMAIKKWLLKADSNFL